MQQGNPLGPLLSSLVVLELLDDLGILLRIQISDCGKDNGTPVGPRSSFTSFLDTQVYNLGSHPCMAWVSTPRNVKYSGHLGASLFSGFDSGVIRTGQVASWWD